MHLDPRRVSALSVAALTSLVLGATALGSSMAATADPAPEPGKRVYERLTDAAKPKDYIKLDLLALNDFHGQLEALPATSSSGRVNTTPAGGAAFLARLLKDERAASRAAGARPITVAAGDLIGATPLLSAAFHDEPTIEAMNQLGLQVASVGNHEFDEGWRELKRMQKGGCLDDGDGKDGQDSCPGGKDFAGADFTYLGANAKWEDTAGKKRESVFPATKIMKVRGVKVGFIGMTLENTGGIVSQAGIEGIEFTDEIETANALVPKLRKRGVKSIVVLMHEGASPATPPASYAYNDCPDVTGPAMDIARGLSPAIDAVVSGHTHQPYNCVVADPKGQPRLLTSAFSVGRMVTKLHLLIDPKTRDIVRPAAYARNLIVENGESVAPVPSVLGLIARYQTLIEPIANQVLGHIEPGDSVVRTPDTDGGDSPLGNLIADGMRADPSVVDAEGDAPAVALMNPGGIRADLVENEAGEVTYGAAFTVQPFNNYVVSMDLTGAQLKTVLNQQWNGTNEGGSKVLQVSGLNYTWDRSLAAEADADALVGDVLVDHDGDAATAMVPLEDETTYRVVTNSYLSEGNDGFPEFVSGRAKLIGGLDVDSLRLFLEGNDPVAASPTDRISSVD
ncbi:bifunctional metallophosphatase/5'-nucleotidase [Nocardioides ferulae]|uniref:bifunctional metallophosphatase/5'-nucleotidase n=1 Tax=Nocardioides ferulae TaxID=2340821 RepID=UPI000EAF8319|nr:5'-nucleotidase C-terminal domain-containing protein [Nocardioides ferulae]